MTNHTEALARVIGREIPFIVESDALAGEMTHEERLTLAQAILASPVIAAIRAEERAGIVEWLRSDKRFRPHDDALEPSALWAKLADAIESLQDEGSKP